MFAIFESGGKQYKVCVGEELTLDAHEGTVGEEIAFDRVLMGSATEGVQSQIGQPYLAGASVKAKVISQDRDKKIRVFKMKQRKGYRRVKGHRQPITRLRITDINLP